MKLKFAIIILSLTLFTACSSPNTNDTTSVNIVEETIETTEIVEEANINVNINIDGVGTVNFQGKDITESQTFETTKMINNILTIIEGDASISINDNQFDKADSIELNDYINLDENEIEINITFFQHFEGQWHLPDTIGVDWDEVFDREYGELGAWVEQMKDVDMSVPGWSDQFYTPTGPSSANANSNG